MFTSKITSILNSNNNVKLILSDISDYTLSDRIFVFTGDLSNCSSSRDPFIDSNNGFKILSIFNNEIILDKTYSSSFLSSVNSYISNICINGAVIVGAKNNSVFIKDCIINNTTIGTTFQTDVNTNDTNINIWNGYITNSNIKSGNLGNWYNNTVVSGNLVVINNTQIGKASNFNNIYINNCNTIDCTFGYITFNNGIHKAILNKVVADNAIINNGIFEDIIFNYVYMTNGIIRGYGAKINTVSFNEHDEPVSMAIQLNNPSDNRIDINSATMLYDYGEYLNSFNHNPKKVLIMDYPLNQLTLTSISSTVNASYLSTWNYPNDPYIFNSFSFLTISNIKSGTIIGGNIQKTIIGNNVTKTHITDATISNCFINNSITSNLLIDPDNINIPVRFKNSIINLYNNIIEFIPVDNCIITTDLYKSEIRNSTITSNVNSCNISNSIVLNGTYINSYSEYLKVKDINYISGIVPDYLNFGVNNISPSKVFDIKTTNVSVSYDTTPEITINLVELIDSADNYIVPYIDDYLQIKIYDASNEYITYLKVTNDIRNDIIDLNDAAENSDPRPVKTVKYNWLNFGLFPLANPTTVQISLYGNFVVVLPNSLNIDLGFIGINNTLIKVTDGGNLDTRLGPFRPVIIIEVDNNDVNSILGSTIKINSTDITYNNDTPTSIFNSNYPVDSEEILPDMTKTYVYINTIETYYNIINFLGPNILNITNGFTPLVDQYTIDINIQLEYKLNPGDVYNSYNIIKNVILI